MRIIRSLIIRVLPLALLAGMDAIASVGQAADRRPNIVFIFTDDHALKAISAYGNALNQTPRIDSLAKEGLILTRSYCGNSICGPSRASIQTGMHSHRNGFFRNYSLPFDADQTTFPKLLRTAGYQTALVGKWHLDSTPTGFDYFEVLPDQGNYYNPDFIQMDGSRTRYEGYCTDLVTDRAFEWFAHRRDTNKPFLLMLQHKAPHRTFAPALRHLELWKNQDLPEPATLFDDYQSRSGTLKSNEMEIAQHLRWDYDLKVRDFNPDHTFNSPCPEYTRMTPAQRAAWDAYFEPLNEQFKADFAAGKYSDPKALTRWKYQRYLKNYLRTIQAVDENVGRVLDYLDAHGLRENTVVVYSSDQGFYLGEHGWFDKRWMFEESFAMPFLIRWPGVIRAGQRVDKLIQNIDYAPTFLDMAGVKIPERMQGRSFLPLLKGESVPWRDAIFYSYFERGEHNVPVHYGVATDRYKLIHFPATDEWNLLDRVKDPQELHSFHADPAYAGVMQDMRRRYAEMEAGYQYSPSTIPGLREEKWWRSRHQEKTREVRERANDVKLVFVGDSITQGWEQAGRKSWETNFAPLGALNLGFSGDRTEHVLWRIKNGEWPAALQPKAVVLMIGTNNTGQDQGRPAADTALGIQLIVEDIRDRAPDTEILLVAITPRGRTADDPKRKGNDEINTLIARLAQRPKIHFLDCSRAFLDAQGGLSAEVMPDALHLSEEGYRRWAEVLLPKLKQAGL